MTFRSLLIAASVMALAACSGAETEAEDAAVVDAVETADRDTAMQEADMTGVATFDADALDAILAAQDEAAQARYDDRNPAATLEFFGIVPGMAVGEALPGGGWYSKILLPYLGDEGRLVGVDYDLDLWPNFNFGTEEFIEGKRSWPETWVADARGWTDSDVDIEAYTFSDLPQDGSLDAFLFIRALHNLNRFEEGRFMDSALANVMGALKPGGLVGVVQHEGPADAPDDWADGSNAYLRRADVVGAFEAAGFTLVGESDVNANPLDMPSPEAGDSVWRLSPTLATSREDAELRAELEAIGESNRMTLLFQKPE
ncbi:MAG: hypothetical protein WBG08_12200 [Litorimonas sp.]